MSRDNESSSPTTNLDFNNNASKPQRTNSFNCLRDPYGVEDSLSSSNENETNIDLSAEVRPLRDVPHEISFFPPIKNVYFCKSMRCQLSWHIDWRCICLTKDPPEVIAQLKKLKKKWARADNIIHRLKIGFEANKAVAKGIAENSILKHVLPDIRKRCKKYAQEPFCQQQLRQALWEAAEGFDKYECRQCVCKLSSGGESRLGREVLDLLSKDAEEYIHCLCEKSKEKGVSEELLQRALADGVEESKANLAAAEKCKFYKKLKMALESCNLTQTIDELKAFYDRVVSQKVPTKFQKAESDGWVQWGKRHCDTLRKRAKTLLCDSDKFFLGTVILSLLCAPNIFLLNVGLRLYKWRERELLMFLVAGMLVGASAGAGVAAKIARCRKRKAKKQVENKDFDDELDY